MWNFDTFNTFQLLWYCIEHAISWCLVLWSHVNQIVKHTSEIPSGVWISSVVALYLYRNIDKLERIQQRGTKFTLRQNNISYEDHLKCLNMLSLEKRRYLFDVTFLYKVLNGYLNMHLTLSLNFYSQADPYKFRHVDDFSLKLNIARTTG